METDSEFKDKGMKYLKHERNELLNAKNCFYLSME